SISANDTKVSNAGSLSRKQHCPHWTVSYTRLIGHFNNDKCLHLVRWNGC
ncbi:hypothetical protein FHG87_025293, partial [Trinorchestia longiramus]